jgi:hypothetical protein
MAGSPIPPTPPMETGRQTLEQQRVVLTGQSAIEDEAGQGTLSLHVFVRKHVLFPARPLKRDTALLKKDGILIRNDEDVVVGSDGCGVVVHRS